MEKELNLLRNYFQRKPEVVLAFLFGSISKEREIEESDVDIAVYLKELRSENYLKTLI